MQRDAAAFLSAIRRLQASATPSSDPGCFIHLSTLRTLQRCVKGLEQARTDAELAAEMGVALEILGELLDLGCTAPGIGHMPRVAELLELLEELETIRARGE
jgi:hypothetical protein